MRRMRIETIITAIWYSEHSRGEPGELSGYNDGIRCWRAGVQFPAGTIDFSLFYIVQTGYPTCTGDFFSGDKA
jgi:hypothetical protein